MKNIVLAMLLASGLPVLADPIKFEDFIRIHTGMHESEVLDIAGPPDYSGAERGAQVRRGRTIYYDTTYDLVWFAKGFTPFSTTITITNGVVSKIRRDKKF